MRLCVWVVRFGILPFGIEEMGLEVRKIIGVRC